MKYNKVLLIDDDPDSNFVNSWIIKKDFAQEVEAKLSAKDALDYIKSQSNLRLPLPEIIFLDIRMPVMDGFGFLEEFNKLSDHIKSHMKIVMLSSSFDKSDYNRAMENENVKKYINKPLTPDALTDL
jgi:CheY-like chemotaxis protein